MRLVISAFVVATSLGSSSAIADEEPQVSIVNGNWESAEMVDGTTTEICAAVGDRGKLGFRSDQSDVEIRTSDASWSLAPDTTGSVTIKAGSVSQIFPLKTFSSTVLVGVVNPEELKPLLAAFDKTSFATMTFGPKHVMTVSLLGSTKVLNDWRTCSATHGFADLGCIAGKPSNPFQ